MLFSDRPRSHYENAPVREVICQLRFPPILSLNTMEPAAFQEAIRDQFPQYARRQDTPAPRMVPGNPPRMETVPPVTNYHFLSANNQWKLNLTKDFISLATLRYPGWTTFARMLDKPLAAFIEFYHPAYFQRIGLRYINLFSRATLGLELSDWDELFTPAYLGVLGQPDVTEDALLQSGVDFRLKLDSSCQCKVHSGISRTMPNGGPAPEEHFVLDIDLFMGGQVACTLAPGGLETLHGHGTRVFEGAITPLLRQAMQPAD